MRVLLLSAYDAQSHRHWHESLRRGIADWEWTLLALPPRHFAWRVRGNPLHWLNDAPALLEGKYDLVLATSMVDLATLRGLVPSLAAIPNVCYFHENQFVYPEGAGRHGALEAQLTSVYTAIAADRLLFNSAFNRDTFLAGCGALMAALPDGTSRDLPARLEEKSSLLPVPLHSAEATEALRAGSALQLVWNHRWEYDKGPDALLLMVRGMVESGLDFTLHVLGQQFRSQPAAFAELRPLLESANARGHWGYVEQRQAYRAILAGSDVVLSTALHDFQGLSVQEACALGCTPLVPDRLVYPEWVEAPFRYGDEAEALDKLHEFSERKAAGQTLPRQNVDGFSAAVLLPQYRRVLERLAA
jgi:hypothetical protein